MNFNMLDAKIDYDCLEYLDSCRAKSIKDNIYIEGVLCAKLIIPNNTIILIAFKEDNQSDLLIEYAIERVYSNTDIIKTYVVEFGLLRDPESNSLSGSISVKAF